MAPRALLVGALLLALALPAAGQNAPGVSPSEIKIGQTMPYSGPVTAFGTLGKGELAFFSMINDRGGVNGRKIHLISLDDGYAPPKTVEQTRRLVEQEAVAFLFSSIGTATNSAVQKYLNDRKVPQLFIGSGASKWGHYRDFPWTIGGVQATFRAEGRIYARYILAQKPEARIGVLYQNDDYGKDYFLGLKDALGDRFDRSVVAESYEPTDPTIDQQILALQAAGVHAIIVGATPKFAAQAIRKVYDIGWKPMFFLSNVAIWVNSVINPAGPEKAVGIISSAYVKDPTDPGWDGDPGMGEWREFMKKYMPDGDASDQNYVNSFNEGMVLVQVLKQCGDDLSRENILKQATNLHELALPMLLPGITVNTGPEDYYPVKQMQLMRWDGKHLVRFGALLSGT
jgi:ABC-type branched-subunit amino acid transport system substrate-binding protein